MTYERVKAPNNGVFYFYAMIARNVLYGWLAIFVTPVWIKRRKEMRKVEQSVRIAPALAHTGLDT